MFANVYDEAPIVPFAAVRVRAILFAVLFRMSIEKPVLVVCAVNMTLERSKPVGAVHTAPIKVN